MWCSHFLGYYDSWIVFVGFLLVVLFSFLNFQKRHGGLSLVEGLLGAVLLFR